MWYAIKGKIPEQKKQWCWFVKFDSSVGVIFTNDINRASIIDESRAQKIKCRLEKMGRYVDITIVKVERTTIEI